MANENNVEIVRNVYDMFGRGDIASLLDILTDDVSWITPDVEGSDFYGRKKGKDGALEFFQGLGGGEVPDTFEPAEFLSDGDKVVVLGKWGATVTATGKRWESDWVHIFAIREGKIASFREFFDNAAACRAFKVD